MVKVISTSKDRRSAMVVEHTTLKSGQTRSVTMHLRRRGDGKYTNKYGREFSL